MCMRAVKIVLLVLLYGLNGCSSTSQPVILCKQNVSSYSIIIKDKANSKAKRGTPLTQGNQRTPRWCPRSPQCCDTPGPASRTTLGGDSGCPS